MANLKDLIVNGAARIIGKIYSSGGFVGNLEGTANGITYCTCETDAATAEKIVTVDNNPNFKLEKGTIIAVKFKYSNSSSTTNVTLNVNNTGAKSIYYNAAAYTSGSSAVCGYANRHLMYMYDGTYWVWISESYDTNSDTKNTAGSTNTTSTIYLIGATEQAANPQTYSDKNLTVHSVDGSKNYSNYTLLTIGEPSRQGVIRFRSLNSNYNQLLPAKGLTADQDIVLPSSAGTLAITTSSSRRYKENIQPITEDEAKKILDVNIVSFDYINKENFGDRLADGRYGVIAEELNEIIPSAILYDADKDPDAVDYAAMVPHLVKMVQMQQKQIDELKTEIQELKNH